MEKMVKSNRLNRWNYVCQRFDTPSLLIKDPNQVEANTIVEVQNALCVGIRIGKMCVFYFNILFFILLYYFELLVSHKNIFNIIGKIFNYHIRLK